MNSVHSFGLFPRAPRFLPQRIAGSGYEIAKKYDTDALLGRWQIDLRTSTNFFLYSHSEFRVTGQARSA